MFIENFAVMLKAVGNDHADTAAALAKIPWPDDATRDQFLTDLTGST